MTRLLRGAVFNQANIYIFLWCLYFSQGSFYPTGSIISQMALLILLCMSIINYYLTLTKYKFTSYLKWLHILLLMFLIYGVILLLSGERLIVRDSYVVTSNYEYLKAILISILPVFSAYAYTLRGQITSTSLKCWIPVWLLLAVVSYYTYQQNALSLFMSREEVTNNMAYRFLALMPVFVLFYRRTLVMVGGLLFCCLFILLGMKRGVILMAVINLSVLLYYMYKNGNRQKKIYIIIASVIVILVLSFVVMQLLSTSDYFVSRIDATLEGNSSGRNDIYSSYWNYYITQDNLFNLLFGNGANATLKIGSNYAHNDWLELLINQGFLGAVIYVVYFMKFYKSIQLKKYGNPFYYIGLKMIFVIAFLSTIFSMSYASMEIFMTLTLGFLLAEVHKQSCNKYQFK